MRNGVRPQGLKMAQRSSSVRNQGCCQCPHPGAVTMSCSKALPTISRAMTQCDRKQAIWGSSPLSVCFQFSQEPHKSSSATIVRLPRSSVSRTDRLFASAYSVERNYSIIEV
ncbi:hypothetical protein RvY_18252 [Ramazzottius varieornatus]|uniref:Uncharacterized protein n=1 Tax=Ramazzottius varieornatus TaxID=947166 RepID=A0A1D1W5M4_RAMVA|nr:hypothetical protein RvY_18252 [Ramazzottius varieornatus]